MTDKLLLLNSDPTIHIQHSIGQPDRNPNWLYHRLNASWQRALASRVPSKPPLVNRPPLNQHCQIVKRFWILALTTV
jgi:hypothetical protein